MKEHEVNQAVLQASFLSFCLFPGGSRGGLEAPAQEIFRFKKLRREIPSPPERGWSRKGRSPFLAGGLPGVRNPRLKKEPDSSDLKQPRLQALPLEQKPQGYSDSNPTSTRSYFFQGYRLRTRGKKRFKATPSAPRGEFKAPLRLHPGEKRLAIP